MTKEVQADSWIDLYGDYLYSVAYYKTGDTELSKDLVQETFFSALKAKDSFRGESSLKTWLTKILHNKIIDYYRSHKTLDTIDDYIRETADSFDTSFFDPDRSGRWKERIDANYISNSTEQYLLGREFQRFLQDCLLKLPPKLKLVFLAKFIDDMDASFICKEYGISPSNYWVIIFRAKVLLRTCLERKGLKQ